MVRRRCEGRDSAIKYVETVTVLLKHWVRTRRRAAEEEWHEEHQECSHESEDTCSFLWISTTATPSVRRNDVLRNADQGQKLHG